MMTLLISDPVRVLRISRHAKFCRRTSCHFEVYHKHANVTHYYLLDNMHCLIFFYLSIKGRPMTIVLKLHLTLLLHIREQALVQFCILKNFGPELG